MNSSTDKFLDLVDEAVKNDCTIIPVRTEMLVTVCQVLAYYEAQDGMLEDAQKTIGQLQAELEEINLRWSRKWLDLTRL